MWIEFNGKNSYNDFGLSIDYFKVQTPQPKTLFEEIQGMNGDGYDVSTIASGGEVVYTGRNINCKINFKGKDKIQLERKYTKVSEWLLSPKNKVTLRAESYPGYFFMAKVQEAMQWEEVRTIGYLIVTFRADPYKQSNDLAGDLLWDDIDFDLPDYIQETKFTISGSKTVTLYVAGSHSIVPKIVTDSSMSCILNNYTAVFDSNKNINWGFKLLPGENVINITGTGEIDFQFRKEVL